MRGIGLPNRQWDLYSQDEEEALIQLRPNSLLLLGYPQSSIFRDKVQQEARLWRELGSPRALLRPYADNIASWDPIEWGNECIYTLDMYISAGIHPELVPANELNIEGFGSNWNAMAEWLYALGAHLRSNTDSILHVPALSPAPDRYSGWVRLRDYNIQTLYDQVDAHIYTQDQIADVDALWNIFGLTVCVTEINQLSPSDYIPQLRSRQYVNGAFWFILRWIDPQPEMPNVDLIGSPHYEDLKNYTYTEKEKEKVSAMTKEEVWTELTQPYWQFPALTKTIIELGGQPIGAEREIDGYTYQLGILPGNRVVVAHARTGDWAHVEWSYEAQDLPELPNSDSDSSEAASH